MSEAKRTPQSFIDNFLFAATNDDNLKQLPIIATLVEMAVEATNHDRLKADRDMLLEALRVLLIHADQLIFRPSVDDSRTIDRHTRELRAVLEPPRAAIAKAERSGE